MFDNKISTGFHDLTNTVYWYVRGKICLLIVTIHLLGSLPLRSLSNSRSDSQDQKKGSIRKERAKKMRGNCRLHNQILNNKVGPHYHFCQYCM